MFRGMAFEGNTQQSYTLNNPIPQRNAPGEHADAFNRLWAVNDIPAYCEELACVACMGPMSQTSLLKGGVTRGLPTSLAILAWQVAV